MSPLRLERLERLEGLGMPMGTYNRLGPKLHLHQTGPAPGCSLVTVALFNRGSTQIAGHVNLAPRYCVQYIAFVLKEVALFVLKQL